VERKNSRIIQWVKPRGYFARGPYDRDQRAGKKIKEEKVLGRQIPQTTEKLAKKKVRAMSCNGVSRVTYTDPELGMFWGAGEVYALKAESFP